MDSSVMPTRYPDTFIVSTTDFFYPLVDDPYIQGAIACANVLSDLYAMGVIECDNLLMLLAASLSIDKPEREIVARLLIQGFNDKAKEAGSVVTGGQTVQNPWPIIGGVAMTLCKAPEIIMPIGAIEGDVIILTKPLGTQVCVNAHQWLGRGDNHWELLQENQVVTAQQVKRSYGLAMLSMCRLNKTAALLMHKYGAHAATDVTGFGIVGHANNLASNQKENVKFEIRTLPIFRHMIAINSVEKIFKLLTGFSAETSGGLFICLPENVAADFCAEIEAIDKWPAWIIGKVLKRDDSEKNYAFIVSEPNIIEV